MEAENNRLHEQLRMQTGALKEVNDNNRRIARFLSVEPQR